MSQNNKAEIGSITWVDLTVDNADEIKNFYSSVVGWIPQPVSMGEYNDYGMNAPSSNKMAAGICYKRGQNADLPSQWLIYIAVDDINKSIENCKALGGKIISGPKQMGEYGVYCVIQDPAGAVCALIQSKD